MRMNAAEARLFRDRWEKVAEIEADELRHLSVEEKMTSLARLMYLGRALGWDKRARKAKQRELELIRDRWVLLKRGH